ncbi:putative YccA/Bax inhibitor family protein [Streptomyces sp. W4I9-2]|nr:putative YccA/Bax inhibitor family protein [Streptomyces sp. W4I9-2]
MHWTAVQKTTGVLLAVVVPTTVIVTWNVISGWEAGETQALLGNLGSLALMVGTAGWLWRTRRA